MVCSTFPIEASASVVLRTLRRRASLQHKLCILCNGVCKSVAQTKPYFFSVVDYICVLFGLHKLLQTKPYFIFIAQTKPYFFSVVDYICVLFGLHKNLQTEPYFFFVPATAAIRFAGLSLRRKLRLLSTHRD